MTFSGKKEFFNNFVHRIALISLRVYFLKDQPAGFDFAIG